MYYFKQVVVAVASMLFLSPAYGYTNSEELVFAEDTLDKLYSAEELYYDDRQMVLVLSPYAALILQSPSEIDGIPTVISDKDNDVLSFEGDLENAWPISGQKPFSGELLANGGTDTTGIWPGK